MVEVRGIGDRIMNEVIEILTTELLWAKNNLSNLTVSLNDADNKVKNIKGWIKDARQKIRKLEDAIEQLGV